jgi:hypothetical protein
MPSLVVLATTWWEYLSGNRFNKLTAERKKVSGRLLLQVHIGEHNPGHELSRWGRSTLDLLNTLRELENWKVSVDSHE